MTTFGEMVQNQSSYLQELKAAIQQEIHCALPGVIHSYDAETQTASVQPVIRDKRSGREYENLPLLLDVPVYFPGGNNVCIGFSVSPGDECLVVFADTCIDAWFRAGGAQNPAFPRRHDLSDGFALVGFRSAVNAMPASDRAFSVRVKVQGEWIEPLAVKADGTVLINGGEA